jgi:hypothetical protein
VSLVHWISLSIYIMIDCLLPASVTISITCITFIFICVVVVVVVSK